MDYKQTEGAATAWRRSHQLIVTNRLNEQPFITFQEEDVVSLNGTAFSVPGSPMAVTGKFTPTDEIPLVNPMTGESLGTTATHQDLYVLLHSLYMQLAQQRDEAVVAPI